MMVKVLIGIPIEKSKTYCVKRLFRDLDHLKTFPHQVGLIFVVTTPSLLMDKIDKLIRRMKKIQRGEYSYCMTYPLELSQFKGKWNRTVLERARELIRNNAIKFGVDYLMCIDADNPPLPNTLHKLLSHNSDIASALLYQRPREGIKCEPLVFQYKWPKPEDPRLMDMWKLGILDMKNISGLSGVIEADATGFGCCLISRKVFKEIPFRSSFYNSEDTEFCHQARMRGFRLTVDLDLHVPHFMSNGRWV